jgi:hypothetical protein
VERVGVEHPRAAVLAERLAQAFSVEDQKRIEFARWLV